MGERIREKAMNRKASRKPKSLPVRVSPQPQEEIAIAEVVALFKPRLNGPFRSSTKNLLVFGDRKVSAVVTQLPRTQHLLILGQCKLAQERETILPTSGKWLISVPGIGSDRRQFSKTTPLPHK